MGSEEHKFSNNYLILKPKDATLRDLFRFILPSGSEKLRNLADYPEGEEECYTCFRRRWIIFRSILLLKFLFLVANTLKMLHAFLNKLLNCGVRGLFSNSITDTDTDIVESDTDDADIGESDTDDADIEESDTDDADIEESDTDPEFVESDTNGIRKRYRKEISNEGCTQRLQIDIADKKIVEGDGRFLEQSLSFSSSSSISSIRLSSTMPKKKDTKISSSAMPRKKYTKLLSSPMSMNKGTKFPVDFLCPAIVSELICKAVQIGCYSNTIYILGGLSVAVRRREWRILDLNDTIDNVPDNEAFRYYGSLTIMASKLAYQHYSLLPSVVNGCWQMNFLEYYHFRNDFHNKARTHAFMFENTATDPNVIVVAFKGTSMFEAYDWMSDFNLSWYNIKGVGRIHSGFMRALGLQKVTGWPKELDKPKPMHNFAYYTLRQKLRDIIETNEKAKFIITGHSLGGALAILFVTVLGYHQETTLLEKLQAVYTYGQPRVGDFEFTQFMEKTVQTYGFKYYRYVYSFDLVPRVPFDGILDTYKHVGGCVYFDSLFNGKFLKEEPNKNYFSLIWLIPKYLTAWWELIRSLIVIPLVKGSDYFEGFVMILFRMFGLLIPGISAHMGPNYADLTYWGKIQIPDHNHIETPILVEDIEAEKINIK